jgi:hypothetical protein
MQREPTDEPLDAEQRREQRITSASARIIRGFSRIGIGSVVVVAIVGVAVTTTVVIDEWVRISSLPDAPWLAYAPKLEASSAHGWWSSDPVLGSAVSNVLAGLAITGIASLVIFEFFRGLGWIIAGFARD